MTVAETIAARVQRIEDLLALHQLKAEYAAAADAKYTPDRRPAPDIAAAAQRQAGCFTDDAVWDGGMFGGTIVGRDGLLDFFRNSPWRFTVHFYVAPVLALDGDTGSGRWRLLELAVGAGDGATVLMTGVSEETYRRTPLGWRIAAMRFSLLHALPLADRPDALRCLIPAGESL